MFEVNNKDITTTFTLFSSVSIGHFEQVNVCWEKIRRTVPKKLGVEIIFPSKHIDNRVKRLLIVEFTNCWIWNHWMTSSLSSTTQSIILLYFSLERISYSQGFLKSDINCFYYDMKNWQLLPVEFSDIHRPPIHQLVT